MKTEIDIVIEEYIGLLATGTCYVWTAGKIALQFPICSGGHGNGYLDLGTYSIRGLISPEKIAKMPNPKPYQTDGYGFAAPMTPLFKTNRTGIWMHPDGNIPGSLGCIVWTMPLEFNKDLYQLLKVELTANFGGLIVNVRDTISSVSN